MTNQSVADVLQGLGLPLVPNTVAAPLAPGLPPLPVVDLHQLFKPITDLVAGFGSGKPGPNETNNGQNPGEVFNQVVDGLSTGVEMGTAGLELLTMLGEWSGSGADAASSTGSQAAANGTSLIGQNGLISSLFGAAASTVATGRAALIQVIAKLATTTAMAAPTLITPFGQAFVMSMIAESLGEATAITSATEAQLGVHSANMSVAGTKVPITQAPNVASLLGSNSTSLLSGGSGSGSSLMSELPQLLETASPAMSGLSAVAPMAQMASGPGISSALKPVSAKADNLGALGAVAAGGLGAAGIGGGMAAGGVGGSGAGNVSAPLSPFVSPGDSPGDVETAEAAPSEPAEVAAAEATPDGASPGMMPMSGVGMAGAGAAGQNIDSGDTQTRSNLVTANNGDAVVGNMEGVTLPVVGAGTSENFTEQPPDKALTL